MRSFSVRAVLTMAALAALVAGCSSESQRMTQDASRPTTPAAAPSVARSTAPTSGLVGQRPGIEMPPGSTPPLSEEVWVIVRPHAPVPVSGPGDFGAGALVARPQALPDAEPTPLPRVHSRIDASVSGTVAAIDVAQRFTNPTSLLLEALYVFPLPADAAIHGFTMTIGERRIHGVIREREEAQRIYESARDQGYTASLLEQARPNVFEQAVANIPPRGVVDIDITYFHSVPYRDGWFELVIPMTVGPRFNPPGWGDGIGAVEPGGASGQPVDVPYVRPGEASGRTVELNVEIEADFALAAVESPSHAIDAIATSDTAARVALSRHETVPDRDFVLRYRAAGAGVETGLVAQPDDRGGGWFSMTIVPPAGLARHRVPVELVFVLDCSGSMKGEPLRQARQAVERGLRRLGPDDAFQVVRFSEDASPLGPRPLPASRDEVDRAVRYVDGLEAGGGTMMLSGLRAALDLSWNGDRTRYVVFLTDGFVGNDIEVLAEVTQRLGAARIFSFGIGSSPNRYLMEQMARLGRGAVAYIGAGDDAAVVMDRFIDRIQHPAVTDVRLTGVGCSLTEVFPRRIPDVFRGRPLVVTGRYHGARLPRIEVWGEVDGAGQETILDAVPANHEALPVMWARHQIADILHAHLGAADAFEVPERVRRVALEYGLVSPYTSYVAVDATRQHDGVQGTLPVATDVPEGVSFDGTVGQ